MTSTLNAVNDSPINTYGQRSLTVNFGLRRTTRGFLQLPTSSSPVSVADFLAFCNLAVGVHSLRLVDRMTSLSVHGVLSSATATGLRAFVPSVLYEKILAAFPAIRKPHTGESPVKHAITHHIVTIRSNASSYRIVL